MAKWKRTVVGSLIKSQDASKPNYIKIRNDLVLKAGQYVNAESKQFQLKSLESAVASGKIKGESAQKARERIEKIPDFVIAELVVTEKSAE